MKGPDVNPDGSIKTRSHQTPKKLSFNTASSKPSIITRRRLVGGLLTAFLGAVGAIQTSFVDSPIDLSGVEVPSLDSDGQSGESNVGASTSTTNSDSSSDTGGFFGEELDTQQV